MEFRWESWNAEHVCEHGVTTSEAEWVAAHARPPFLTRRENDKWMAKGQTWAGRYLQVVFVYDPEDTVFVLHARPLTENEKRQLRRRWRR